MNNNIDFNRNASFWEIMEGKKTHNTYRVCQEVKKKCFLQTEKTVNGVELQAVEDHQQENSRHLSMQRVFKR